MKKHGVLYMFVVAAEGETMTEKRITGKHIVFGIALLLFVLSTGMATSLRLALRHTEHRVAAQDALIAALQFELESAKRERVAPVTPQIPVVEASAAAMDTATDDALRHALQSREQEIARLQARIAELEARGEERDAQRQGRAERMQAWRERMQQQDPETLERRRQEGREMMGRVAETTRDRLLFMQAMPTDGLSPEYLENHNALMARLIFFDEAMQQIAEQPENPENRELMPRIFANMQGLDEMLQMQREVLLDDLARDIGYEGEDAGVFVNAVSTITEMTTIPGPGYWRRALRGNRTR